MGIIGWIVIGLVAGGLAKLLMPGKDPGGCFVTMLIGIVGALVGGFVGNLIGWGSVTGWDVRSLVLAVLGSVILLAIYRALKK